MKNKTVGAEESEKKADQSAAALPWWAKAFIARSAETVSPMTDFHHTLHHCSKCGCALISTNVAYRYSPALCPECSTKNSTS